MKRRLRALVGNGELAHSGVQTVTSMALTLGLSLLSGVMIARLLGTSGRGEVTAIVTLNQTIGWFVSFGCFQAVVYHSSKHPERAPETVGTWIAIALPAGLIGVAVGELLAGTLLHAQSADTLALARVWLLMIPLLPLSEALSGALVASQDFAATNFLRLLQQAMAVGLFFVLWLTGEFTVATAMAAQAVVVFTYIALLYRRTSRRVGITWPRRELIRPGLLYGVRAHSSNVGGQLSARLDLLIMPAFLASAQVGLYAVAVSVTGMIVTVAGSMSQIVQPVTAAAKKGSELQVARMFHATIVIGVALAVPTAILAPWLLTLVYSHQFADAATALRLLAPGAVLLAMTNILVSGLFGKNRPATGGFAQLPGTIFTLITLVLFLRSGGINAAALISSITYTISVCVAAFFYLRYSETTARELFDLRPTMRLLRLKLRARRHAHTAKAAAVEGGG